MFSDFVKIETRTRACSSLMFSLFTRPTHEQHLNRVHAHSRFAKNRAHRTDIDTNSTESRDATIQCYTETIKLLMANIDASEKNWGIVIHRECAPKLDGNVISYTLQAVYGSYISIKHTRTPEQRYGLYGEVTVSARSQYKWTLA